MKNAWPLQLFISMSIGLLSFGLADATTMAPITACTDCHGTNPQATAPSNIPIEGAQRNNPAHSIIGSHDYHMRNTPANTCASCHVMPTTLDHRDGKINMASPMHNGVTYSAAVAGVVRQDNQLSPSGLGTCSGGTGGCHSSASPVWGAVSTCQTCHGYPPVTTVGDPDNVHPAVVTGPVNHVGTGATVNTKDSFVAQHGGCQICHGTQSTTDGTGNTHLPASGYVVATFHTNGNITMNGPVGSGTGYDPMTRGCTAACHANDATHRMTASGLTVDYFDGTGLSCLTCHETAQPSPVAQALNASVTTRVAVTASFSLASRHIRSRTSQPNVTTNDCGICHMEGNAADGSINGTYHKNGYVELRDPDTGVTIKGVTHSGTTAAAGAYTATGTDARPVRFSRNLGSATIEADTAAIMINQCLKCHDANGALSASAIVPGGSAGKPFAGTVAANPSGNVLDVAAQFASSNRSFHPVLVRQNNGYVNTGGSRMVAPWNSVTKTATTTVYGPLISCWDCHAPNNTLSTVTLTTSGIHGGDVNGTDSVPLRGNVYVNGTTNATNLCLSCHVVSGGTTNHGTGSSITSSTNGSMTYFQNRCYFCHGSNATKPARPVAAADAHGFNTRFNGIAFPAVNNGYAFLRNEGWYANGYTQSIRSIGATTYTPTCGGMGIGGGCSRTSMGGYTPGGVY